MKVFPAWRRVTVVLAALSLGGACATQRSENTPMTGDDVPVAETSTDDVQMPGDDVQTPGDDVQTPADDVQTPVDDVPMPTDDVQTPVDDVVATPDVPVAPTDVPRCGMATDCMGTCTSLMTDSHNCGACGRACTGTQVCTAGSCACPSGTTACGGACVTTASDPMNCGACGRACTAGMSCAAGACTLVCTGGTTACAGSCVDTSRSTAHCGACGRACTAGATCTAGACVGGTLSGQAFQITSLASTGCTTADHNTVTGDDRGGIAISSGSLFYSGDTATGRFDLNTLAVTRVAGATAPYDAMLSDLATGTAYTLAAGTRAIDQTGGMVTALLELDATTGAVTTRSVTLSRAIDMTGGSTFSSTVGIFSGWGRAVILARNRAYHVELPSGVVTDFGALTFPAVQTCENWAVWGVAEFYGGALYVDYVRSATTISRMRVPEGTVTTLATFTDLSDMCSFTVSPAYRRWYFHHEYDSQLRTDVSASETAGYCPMTFTGPTVPCPTGTSLCGSVCVNTTTDTANCGTCGRACVTGQTCAAGACACPSGQTVCGTRCVATATDTTNCGMCGRACATGQTCAAGTCACPAGQTLCGTRCVDMNADTTNCGACGRACATGQLCLAGACGGGRRYTASDPGAASVWINACGTAGHTTVLGSADDTTVSTTLPFAMPWWGTLLAAGRPVAVCSNGWLAVDSTTTTASLSGSIPSASDPNGVIAPQWGDLITSGTGVCIVTVGAAPNRSFVVQWDHARNYNFGSPNGDLNFEVVLHETTGVVDVLYDRMDTAMARTVGIENPTGTDSVAGCGSSTCTIAASTKIRFSPSP